MPVYAELIYVITGSHVINGLIKQKSANRPLVKIRTEVAPAKAAAPLELRHVNANPEAMEKVVLSSDFGEGGGS